MTDESQKPRRPKGGRDAPGRAPRPAGGGRRERAPAHAEGGTEEGERIAKRLARAGIASRREAEGLVADGRIRVNGQVLSSPAVNVSLSDRIELDGTEIPQPERTRLFLFHKPAGVVTTNRDPEGRRTVFDVLPEGLPRLLTVGRLDINTEGLLLLTNDGGLARVLELPATGWLRRYRVRVHGEVDEGQLKGLAEGIAVEGIFYGAIEAELERVQGSNAWLSIGLREGKNREVKNVLGALGLEVNRLIRVSYGPFQLGELAEGAVQELKGRMLRDQLGDRLIAEAGADFEAEIRKPFSNKPTVRGSEPAMPPAPRQERRAEPGEGGLIKNRKRERERFREDGLARLGTKPDRGFGGKPGRAAGPPAGEKREERGRTANVWMAPGARPQGKAAAAKPAPAKSRRQDGGEGFQKRPPRPFHEGRGEPRARGGGENAEPQVKREHPAEAGERKNFRRDLEPRPPRDGGGNAERPFRPRPEAEGTEARPGRGDRPLHRSGAKPAAGREDGGDRPFKPRRPGQEAGARTEGARPFKQGPRRDDGSKPFAKGSRKDAAPRPAGKGPRPNAGAKPFAQKRGEPGAKKPFAGKPRRDERPADGAQPKRPFKRRDRGTDDADRRR